MTSGGGHLMNSPRNHRSEGRSVVNGEVQHLPATRTARVATRQCLRACAVRNNGIMASPVRQQVFMRAGDEKLVINE